MPLIKGLVALVVLSLIGACSSGGASSSSKSPGNVEREAQASSGGGRSIWDLLEEGRGLKAKRETRIASSGGTLDLPRGAEAEVQEWFSRWRAGSANYVESRARLETYGEGGRQIMVDNLVRYAVAAIHGGNVNEARRTRDELLRYVDVAAPTLVEGLVQGYGDSVVRDHCGQILAELGDPALPYITEGLDRAPRTRDDRRDPRQALTRSVRLMGSAHGVSVLSAMAGRDENYQTRLEALQGLGQMGGPGEVPVFVQCLEDRDRSVRKFAARYAPGLRTRDRALLTALVSCMEGASSAGERDVSDECRQALSRITGRDMGSDSGAWRSIANGGN